MKRLPFLLILVALLFPALSYAGTIGKPANNLGLVGYWPMNEGTGTTTSDMSGKKHAGTFTIAGAVSPRWITGKFSGGVQFPATGAYIDFGQVSDLSFSGSFTVSAWINSTSTGQGGIFARWYNTNGNRSYRFFMRPTGDLQLELSSDGTNTTGCVSNSKINDGTWKHVVVSYNSTTGSAEIFVNGVLDSTACNGLSTSLFNNNAKVQIGTSDTDTQSNSFVGSIDEVRAYNRTFSAPQVRALYAAGSARIGTSAATLDNGSTLGNGLVGHWTFDGADFTDKVYDRSGQSNNGYFMGAATSGAKTLGKIGQSLRLNGSTSYVDIPYNASINPSATLSVGAWVYHNADSGNIETVADFGSAGTVNESYYILYRGDLTPKKWEFGIRQSNNTYVGTPTVLNVPPGSWHHILLTADGSFVRLYVDGILANTPDAYNGTIKNDTSSHLIVGSTWTDRRYWNGKIDDVRIYNRALSSTEAKQLSSLGQQNTGASSQTLTSGSTLQSGLVGHWTFDGADVTDKVYDKSASANNGYFKGGATTSAKIIGKLGQALKFNGSSSQVNVGSAASLDDIDPITISAWIRPDSDMTSAGEIFDKTADGGIYTDGPDLWYDYASSNRLLFAQGFTGGGGFAMWYVDTSPIVRGEWNHVVVTYSRASAANSPTFYINGAQQTTTADGSFPAVGSARSDAAADAVIGAYGASNTAGFFKGRIDDVRVYNRILSASDVKQLYNLGR